MGGGGRGGEPAGQPAPAPAPAPEAAVGLQDGNFGHLDGE